MRSLTIRCDSRYLTVAVLLLFMAVAFLIRMIPALFIHNTGFLYTMDSDTWYTLRQVEVMVNHFPQYDWFDPMTAFPTGKTIDWGPLFPFITAALCLLTGATTHNAIIYVSSLVSPLMAALMVPVTYFVGKTIWDRKTGLVAAGLISVVSLLYYSITTFGLVIHHIGEVLFSSLFFLVYLYYIVSIQPPVFSTKDLKTLFVPIVLATLAGVLYFLALLTSPTTMLALIVIAIFMFVQSAIDHLSGRSPERLLVLNLIFLLVSSLLLLQFGFKQPGLSVTSYTAGLVYLNLALIAETVLLSGISFMFRGKAKPYLLCLVALAVAGVAVVQIYPPFAYLIAQGQGLLFGSSQYSVGVFNTLPLSPALAWEYFSVGIVLMTGGLLVLVYHIVKRRNATDIFLLVWSAFMLLITIQYQRFAYFSTVNIALLCAICITEPFSWKKKDGTAVSLSALTSLLLHRHAPADNGRERQTDKHLRSPKTDKTMRAKKSPKYPKYGTDELKIFCFGAVILLAVALFAVSLYHDVDLGLTNPNREISPDWIESLNWLGNNTPSTGVDYFQQYDAATFSYPSTAYGILAEWGAGHWITFFSRRIPITNPFQNNLFGSSGGYAFFLSQDESQADGILQSLGGRYVITSSNLALDNFASLSLWEDNSPDVSPYMTQFMVPGVNDPSVLSPGYAFDNAYYRTMIVRLHLFDGSMQVPGTVDYIRYRVQPIPATGGANGYTRVITSEQTVDLSRPHNDTPIIAENTGSPQPGSYANMFADFPNSTLVNVPALEHYRLVHESPDTASVQQFPGLAGTSLPGIKEIKIFEYVKGAHIPGTGTIEIPIETGTGRTFIYRQESENGEFIVPYSTSGNSYDVRATGPYHIAGTDQYIDVTENAVVTGTTVNG